MFSPSLPCKPAHSTPCAPCTHPPLQGTLAFSGLTCEAYTSTLSWYTHMHTLSAHTSVPQSQSLYNTHQTHTCVCPGLTPAHPYLQGPFPLHSCCYSKNHPDIRAALSTGQTLPPSCTFPLDPSPDPPQTLPEASSNAAHTPQPTGLSQGALLSLHRPTLLSTPVIKGRK